LKAEAAFADLEILSDGQRPSRARRVRDHGSAANLMTARSGAIAGLKASSFGSRPRGWVLHHGHAVYILVESVEKPTDNGSASLLCLTRR
jgi:hypothetical protein